jgi:hypothetical protein
LERSGEAGTPFLKARCRAKPPIERAARVPHSDASPGERHTDEHPKAAPTTAE